MIKRTKTTKGQDVRRNRQRGKEKRRDQRGKLRDVDRQWPSIAFNMAKGHITEGLESPIHP